MNKVDKTQKYTQTQIFGFKKFRSTYNWSSLWKKIGTTICKNHIFKYKSRDKNYNSYLFFPLKIASLARYTCSLLWVPLQWNQVFVFCIFWGYGFLRFISPEASCIKGTEHDHLVEKHAIKNLKICRNFQKEWLMERIWTE